MACKKTIALLSSRVWKTNLMILVQFENIQNRETGEQTSAYLGRSVKKTTCKCE